MSSLNRFAHLKKYLTIVFEKQIRNEPESQINGKIRFKYYLKVHDPVPVYFKRPNYSYLLMFMLIEELQTWPWFSALTQKDQVKFA